MTLKEELFSKYQLSFSTLSAFISSTYDPEILSIVDPSAMRDSLSDGQTSSKLWVIDQLSKIENIDTKSVCVLGGWVGILCRFIFDYLGTRHVTNIEIDGSLRKINGCIMKPFLDSFTFEHADMYSVDYYSKDFDVLINTSAEHIASIQDWIEKIPENKIVVIQSNNFFSHPQHINCVNNEEELILKVLSARNVKTISYSGTLELPIYNRFMVIAKT